MALMDILGGDLLRLHAFLDPYSIGSIVIPGALNLSETLLTRDPALGLIPEISR